MAHNFSAGFISRLYGGKNTRAILSGMLNFFALFNAPLSRNIFLNSSGFWSDRLSKNI